MIGCLPRRRTHRSQKFALQVLINLYSNNTACSVIVHDKKFYGLVQVMHDKLNIIINNNLTSKGKIVTTKKISRKIKDKVAEESRILSDLKEKAQHVPKRITAIQERVYKLVRKYVREGVSLADELIEERRKEKI